MQIGTYLYFVCVSFDQAQNPDSHSARISAVIFRASTEQGLVELHLAGQLYTADISRIILHKHIPAEATPIDSCTAITYTGRL